MYLQFLTREGVSDLKNHFTENLPYYLAKEKSYFEEYLNKKGYLQDSNIAVDETFVKKLQYTDNDKNDDIVNATLLHKALFNLKPYVAMDERIWCALCHTLLFDYVVSKRNKIIEGLKNISSNSKSQEKERLLKALNNSFFTHTIYGLRRGTYVNCVSSLWWGAYLIYDVKNKDNPYELLKTVAKYGFPSTILPLSASRILTRKETCLGFLKEVQALRNQGMTIKRDPVFWGVRYLNCIAGLSMLDMKTEAEIRDITRKYYTEVFKDETV